MILAIVGTREFPNPRALVYARLIITYEVRSVRWDSFVTGDAPGIDTLVSQVCDELREPCEMLVPEKRQWEGGFKQRNMAIAGRCDELLAIRWPGSPTYGSGWTADYARSLGKPVTEIQITLARVYSGDYDG